MRGPIWVAGGTMVAAALSFAFQTGLSLIMSESAFGVVASAMIGAAALAVFTSMGSQNVMLDAVERQGRSARDVVKPYLRIWGTTSVIGATVVGIVVAVVPALGSALAFTVALCCMISLFSILASSRQSARDFPGVGLLLIAPEAAKVIALAALWLAGLEDLHAAYWLMSGAFAAACLITILLGLPSARGISPLTWRDVAVAGFPYALSGLLFMLYYRASILVMSSQGYLTEAGSLAVIYLFITAILMLPNAYSQRFLLGRWHAVSGKRPEVFRSELKRQVLSVLAFTIPISAAWFFCSRGVLAWLYGDAYLLAQQWAPAFALVLLSRGVNIPLQAASSIASLRWPRTWVICAAAAVTVGLTIALLPSIGFASAYWAALAAEVVLASALYIMLHRRGKARSVD
ncbi:hypothetical protein H9651_13110 [Microbacterium sp. Sa4CUA7]|uniref:Polysaccharide biosynthesis protein n=1 Tax=Microbacterium pullorum TaxID=2762236 RepID=A0ABR8S531_9MICO|nr:hypothetical protein [Microbacterium pullorum]MBD7958583.1 hypothetical protein [Microbacterium pullorum]